MAQIALAAGPGGLHRDGRTHRQVRDAGPQSGDLARELMPLDHGVVGDDAAGVAVGVQSPVGRADGNGADAHQHFPGARLGSRYLIQVHLARCVKAGG